MDGNKVPAILTVTSPEDALFALDNMWSQLAKYSNAFPLHAEVSSLATLISQWAVETSWGQDMWNNNWIFVPKDLEDQHDFTTVTLKRNINGIVLPHHEDVRSYRSLEDGALDLILWMATKRYSSAWSHLLAGDTELYLTTLDELGYFADRHTVNYKYTVINIANKIYEHPTIISSSSAGFSKQERAHVLNLVAMTLWGLAGDNA